MKATVRVLAVVAVAVALFSTTGCNKLRARDQLNKGVQSYKNARYEEAIEHFKNAVAFDPGLINARLYLATAYAQQYIPNADNAENVRNAEQAIDQFKKVLEKDPNNVNSIKGIASLYLQMKKFNEAKDYFDRVTKIDPNDPESYYSVAVIDWTQSYRPRMAEKAKLGLGAAEPIKDKRVCEQLRTANLSTVEDGMQKLQKALQLRPDYEDAMAYMNLLYREKADMECGNASARAADLKSADDWVDRTMAARKAKEQKQQARGIVMEPAK